MLSQTVRFLGYFYCILYLLNLLPLPEGHSGQLSSLLQSVMISSGSDQCSWLGRSQAFLQKQLHRATGLVPGGRRSPWAQECYFNAFITHLRTKYWHEAALSAFSPSSPPPRELILRNSNSKEIFTIHNEYQHSWIGLSFSSQSITNLSQVCGTCMMLVVMSIWISHKKIEGPVGPRVLRFGEAEFSCGWVVVPLLPSIPPTLADVFKMYVLLIKEWTKVEFWKTMKMSPVRDQDAM